MWSFQYKHGDKPLEGFTIERAAGRGGFGEVYYAVSDAGREVALKVVTGYEQIELRGISQCMNLKSPHLVTIFDVKHNAEGKPFVIMEFVSGPSLRQLIDESPSGLGTQKSAFFLREMAKGLSYLHDCGIVHRDLKPGNIFYENGYVKIGDYGLSKAISTTQHSGQTVTVGTVHYMAPEVGAGKYDRSIDIYALGAVLYEMLTGVPPFVGASPSEVLLKHLSAQPDCTNIPEPFATTIKRAMAKDPNDRFKNVQEMVESVFGAEHVRQSVSVFAPEDLSVVAGRVAQHVGGGAGSSNPTQAPPRTPSPDRPEPTDPWERMAWKFERAGERVAEGAQRAADRFEKGWSRQFARGQARAAGPDDSHSSRDMTVPIDDPLPRRARVLLALITATVVSIAAAVLSQGNNGKMPITGIFVGFAILGGVGGMRIVRTRVFPHLERETSGMQRFVLGGAAALGMFLLGVGPGSNNSRFLPSGTWIAMIAPLFMCNVMSWQRPDRRERVQLGSAIGVALIAFILSQIFHGSGLIAIAVVAGISLAAQALAPWGMRAGAAAKPGFGAPYPKPDPMSIFGNVNVAPEQAEQMRAAGVKVYGNINVGSGGLSPLQSDRPRTGALAVVPAPVRVGWTVLFAFTLSLSIAMFVFAGNSRNDKDLIAAAGTGCAVMFIALVSLVRMFTGSYFGIWNYAIRPALVWAAMTAIVFMGIILGNTNPRTEEMAIGSFLIAFSSILLLTVLFIPGKRYRKLPPVTVDAGGAMPPPLPDSSAVGAISPFKRLWALALTGLAFCGFCGIQRLYVGKIGTGILWLFTWGLFGIGQIVDGIMILSGSFTDKQGRRLVLWEDWSELDGEKRAQAQMDAPRADRMSFTSAARGHALGLLSALAGLLVFAASVLGVALALDLPGAVTGNVFTEHFAQHIQKDVFNGYVGWPELAYQVGFATEAVLVLAAVAAILFARQPKGLAHMFRAFVGVALLMTSIATLHGSLRTYSAWETMAPMVAEHQIPQAVNAFMNSFRMEQAVTAMALFLVSQIVLAWPAATPRLRPQPQIAPVTTGDGKAV